VESERTDIVARSSSTSWSNRSLWIPVGRGLRRFGARQRLVYLGANKVKGRRREHREVIDGDRRGHARSRLRTRAAGALSCAQTWARAHGQRRALETLWRIAQRTDIAAMIERTACMPPSVLSTSSSSESHSPCPCPPSPARHLGAPPSGGRTPLPLLLLLLQRLETPRLAPHHPHHRCPCHSPHPCPPSPPEFEAHADPRRRLDRQWREASG
jgi:hypothetical protein